MKSSNEATVDIAALGWLAELGINSGYARKCATLKSRQ